MVSNKNLPYEIFCIGCKSPLGYTNHAFRHGERIEVIDNYVNHPDGRRARPGDLIECQCPGGRPTAMSLHPNPSYAKEAMV